MPKAENNSLKESRRTKRKLNAYLRLCLQQHEKLFLDQGIDFLNQFPDLPKLIASDGSQEKELNGAETIRFITRIRGTGIHPGFVIDYLAGFIDYDRCMFLFVKALAEIAKRLQEEIDERTVL
jgi:hypothetical protein